MTKFIDCSQGAKEVKTTVFTHFLCPDKGWVETTSSPKNANEVKYMGKCKHDGHIFIAYYDMSICQFKGIKGDEFN